MKDELFYRGTQREAVGGVRKGLSFTPSLPVAIIWSAEPGDPWGSRNRSEAHFLPTSTVHAVHLDVKNPLVLSERITTYLGDVLRLLQFGKPGGISVDDARRIYNYMHNRLTGKAPGGEFQYAVYTDDGQLDEDDVPLSFTNPQTVISLARALWDDDPTPETADSVKADTFIFADSPTVQKAAKNLGYDALVYDDVFQGGERASKVLLGENLASIRDIGWDYDLEHHRVPYHATIRPLDPAVIVDVWSKPTTELLAAENT